MDPVIQEWAYAREVMRRFGFPADDLFFHVSSPKVVVLNGIEHKVNKPVISLVLNSQGKTFTWTIGLTNLSSKEDAEEAYKNLCETWNAGEDESGFLESFKNSDSYKQVIPLARALREKGFVLGSEFIGSILN